MKLLLKRKIVIMAALIAVFILWRIWISMTLFMETQSIIAIPWDLNAFYLKHDRLPLNWDEFVDWTNNTPNMHRWHSDSLKQFLYLKWGLKIDQPFDGRLLFTSDPRVQNDVDAANGMLFQFITLSKGSEPDKPTPK